MLRGPQGIAALQEKHQQIRALEEQNATLARNIAEKKKRIESLANDPSAQATAVEREQHKIRRGETLFDTPGGHTSPSNGASQSPQR